MAINKNQASELIKKKETISYQKYHARFQLFSFQKKDLGNEQEVE